MLFIHEKSMRYIAEFVTHEGKYMPLILLWAGLALLLGFVASANGRSFWGWFILGLIIDPILAGLLYWLIAKDRT